MAAGPPGKTIRSGLSDTRAWRNSSMWLIAHQGCSFYRKKHGEIGEPELRQRQLRDLRAARERLRERHPALAVHLIYASLQGERVVFSDLEPATGSPA
jgi:beta-glucosidase-like glycosyl hydrolase